VDTEPITEGRIRCPVCGQGHLERRVITDRFEYEGGKKKVTVVAENVPVRVCTHCQETFSGPDAGLIRNRAICRALGLLTPEEIGAIRERLGLSQAEFAKLTGIGEATVSRWERGRLLQNKAMDRYVRLLAANPDNVRLLGKPTETGTAPVVPGSPLTSRPEESANSDICHEIWKYLKARLQYPEIKTRNGRIKWDFTQMVFCGLEDCRDALATHFQLEPEALNAFRSMKTPIGRIVQYMLDFTWTTYPDNRKFYHEKRFEWPTVKYEILLAAESERGNERSLDDAYRKALEDFVKLIDIKARIKVMVYRVRKSGQRQWMKDLQDGFENILRRHRGYDASERWLFVGIPWHRDWEVRPVTLDEDIKVVTTDLEGKPTLTKPPWA
jgi:HTH-type transcriptional regulator/antitoxin MqsA